MLEEDLEDTHLCIKCSTTIVGLDNYVQHRKNHCATKATNTINRDIVHMDHSYGTFDFSEQTSYHKPSEEVEKGGKSLSESYDLPYDLGADVFFSSLELQSSSKRSLQPSSSTAVTTNKLLSGKVLSRKPNTPRPANPEQDDEWIATQNNSENLMKAVRDISGTKKCDNLFKIIPFHHDSPEPSDDEDDEDDDDDDDDDDYNNPSQAQAGGKWKPEAVQPTIDGSSPRTSIQWFERYTASQDQDDFEQDLNPPPGHTKGKWVPGTKITKLDYKEDVEIERIYSDQFWCNTCNRKLASKLLYERHLKSSLHLKRSKPERELEQASQELKTDRFSERVKKPSIFLNQEIYFSSEKSVPSSTIKKAQRDETAQNSALVNQKRIRRKFYTKCETCKTRLPKHLMGKHLISHYHYRRMISNPTGCFDVILDNMEKIVHQMPFQCHPCRYYFNTEERFLAHWKSEEHCIASNGPGLFWCSFCKFDCRDNVNMGLHLVGTVHKEVVLAINRSVPIIVRKKCIIECEKCLKVFRYNIELRKHAPLCTLVPTGTASDEYQSKFVCEKCNERCKSRLALQKHELVYHNELRYFCSACKLTFETCEEIKKHRASSDHKMKSKSKNKTTALLEKKCKICGKILKNLQELKQHIQGKHPHERHLCPMCGESFVLPQELSRHVRKKLCISSMMEDEQIHQSTDLLNEPKEKETMQIPVHNISCEDPLKLWKCDRCRFRTHIQSEFLYHGTLHNIRLTNSREKLPCPICNKMFRKHSLRCHLRQHTNEKVFSCKICPMKFSRKYNLKAHVVNVHEKKIILNAAGERESENSYQCDVCGKNFSKKQSLKQHADTHNERDNKFRCPIEACIFIGRNASDLQSHLATHSNEKNFKCEFDGCDYAGKTLTLLKRHTKKHEPAGDEYHCPHCKFKTRIRGHLKRHSYIHTKEKPYKCPHCTYSCNNLENLRKHVLGTKLHPGKFIYECKLCNEGKIFKTNSQRLYRVHVILLHKTESNLDEILSLRPS